MSEQEENELICEKLLGWKRSVFTFAGAPGEVWKSADGEKHLVPTFTDWASAGLILEAFARNHFEFDLDYFRGQWRCDQSDTEFIGELCSTGPLAIRAAALAYIRQVTS